MLQRHSNDTNNLIPFRQHIRRRPFQNLVAEIQMVVEQNPETFLNDRASPSSIEVRLLRDQDLDRNRVVDR